MAVPINLTVMVPTLAAGAAGWLGASAGASWARIGAAPAVSSKIRAKRLPVTRCNGLLSKVFKAGDISKESKLQFSYRAVSLLGND